MTASGTCRSVATTTARSASVTVAAARAARWKLARRLGQTRHAGRVDYYLPLRPGAQALATHRFFAPQGQVDHAPLAAVHGVESERLAGTLHLLRRRQR